VAATDPEDSLALELRFRLITQRRSHPSGLLLWQLGSPVHLLRGLSRGSEFDVGESPPHPPRRAPHPAEASISALPPPQRCACPTPRAATPDAEPVGVASDCSPQVPAHHGGSSTRSANSNSSSATRPSTRSLGAQRVARQVGQAKPPVLPEALPWPAAISQEAPNLSALSDNGAMRGTMSWLPAAAAF
jgi:hypothetical protein